MATTRSATDIQVARFLGRSVEEESAPLSPEGRPMTVTEQQVSRFLEGAQPRAPRRRKAAEEDDD
jgi:hypothetical protein